GGRGSAHGAGPRPVHLGGNRAPRPAGHSHATTWVGVAPWPGRSPGLPAARTARRAARLLQDPAGPDPAGQPVAALGVVRVELRQADTGARAVDELPLPDVHPHVRDAR